jgi:hypothetical protein
MNANTDINLTELQDAIVADIQAAFPAFQTVQFYRGEGEDDGEERNSAPVPACLLDLTEFEHEPDNDPGTEQICVIGHFEAELMISFRTDRPKHAIRLMAANLAAWLHNRRWNDPANPGKKIPTGEVQVIGAYRDDFSGRGTGKRDTSLPQFEIWKVEWRQRMNLGTGIWSEDGYTTPTTPVYSYSPEIGIGYEPAYKELGELQNG